MNEKIGRLSLRVNPGDAVVVGDVVIKYQSIKGDQVQLIVEAPVSMKVRREHKPTKQQETL